MFHRGHIYTVHVKDDAPAEEQVVLVREGFSFWAFAFSIFWLLYHRLWMMSLVYVVFSIGLAVIVGRLGMSEISLTVLQFGLSVWLGCAAEDARREALESRDYELREVVCAESEMLATRRYFDRQSPSHVAA